MLCRLPCKSWQSNLGDFKLLVTTFFLLQTWVKNTQGIYSALASWNCRGKYFYRMKAVTPLSALLTSLRLMILTPDIPGGYNSWPRTSPEDTITLKDKQICLEALSPWVWMDTFNPSEEVPERYPRIALEVSKMYPRSTQDVPQKYPRGTPDLPWGSPEAP